MGHCPGTRAQAARRSNRIQPAGAQRRERCCRRHRRGGCRPRRGQRTCPRDVAARGRSHAGGQRCATRARTSIARENERIADRDAEQDEDPPSRAATRVGARRRRGEPTRVLFQSRNRCDVVGCARVSAQYGVTQCNQEHVAVCCCPRAGCVSAPTSSPRGQHNRTAMQGWVNNAALLRSCFFLFFVRTFELGCRRWTRHWPS